MTAAGERPLTWAALTARATAELVPAGLGSRSHASVMAKLRRILSRKSERPSAGPFVSGEPWTPAQVAALEELIRNEEAKAAAANKESPTNTELTNHAMKRLVPGVVGHRGWKAMNWRIGRARKIY